MTEVPVAEVDVEQLSLVDDRDAGTKVGVVLDPTGERVEFVTPVLDCVTETETETGETSDVAELVWLCPGRCGYVP